jgi:hypothetical protein
VRAVVVRVVAGFFLLVAAMGIVWVVGVRRRSAAVVNAVRKVSRATKALPLKTAGTGDAYASVVRHVGRASGKSYETPVHAVATDGGFDVASYPARWKPAAGTPAEAAAFARKVVAGCGPLGQDRARNLLRAAGKLAAWAIPLGLQPVPEVLLHPPVIERRSVRFQQFDHCGSPQAMGWRR